MKSEQKKAIEAVVKANDKIVKAREEYTAALLHCAELGVPYTEIGRAIDKTDTAVRMYVARKRDERESA